MKNDDFTRVRKKGISDSTLLHAVLCVSNRLLPRTKLSTWPPRR